VTNNIEAKRLKTEELAGVPIDDEAVFNWWEPDQKAARVEKIVSGRKVASDDGLAGLPVLGPDFLRLRFSLTASEVTRFRALGNDASEAMENMCFALVPGMRESDIAASFALECNKKGIRPIVLLVACDDRLRLWRHPIYKDVPLEKYGMVVLCGRRQGLVVALTRLFSVGDVEEDVRRRHEAVCFVDATMIASTRPGSEARSVLDAAQKAYAERGYDDEWKLHHQGGAIGYQPREYVANPALTTRVENNQAFAWNPSITGTKSEDTVLVNEDGFEILSAASDRFPSLEFEIQGAKMSRPDFLVIRD
jgi:Xaa-Pro aminopeptidase